MSIITEDKTVSGIYIYINFKAINDVLDAKMVLKTHLLIKIFWLLYIYIYIYNIIIFCLLKLKKMKKLKIY